MKYLVCGYLWWHFPITSPFIHGNGQYNLGPGYMLILTGHSRAADGRCFFEMSRGSIDEAHIIPSPQQQLQSIHGIPHILVTSNGLAFASYEQTLMSINGIIHY